MSAFWQKKGCLFSGKNQRFIKIRVLFWPEISALGEFFNFDNERMHPPKYPSDPPPPPPPPRGQDTKLGWFTSLDLLPVVAIAINTIA